MPGCFLVGDSLWIDELHTSWVVAGPWKELISRAQSGNQTIGYFALLKLLHFGTAPSEVSLRTLSMVAWWGAMFLSFSRLLASMPQSSSLSQRVVLVSSLTLCACLDWVHWFYSTEARPYGLALFLASCLLLAMERSFKRLDAFHWPWVLAASGLVWVHPTTGLVVMASWLAIALWNIWLRNDRTRESRWIKRTLLYRCSELLVLILSWLPLLGFASELFQHRRQWESFAGNADLTYLLGMHPIHYWIGIPLAILLLQSWWARHWFPKLQGSSIHWGLLWLGLVPMIAAWSLTALHWIPLMHARYLIIGHWAIWLLSGCLMARMNHVRWMAISGLLIVAAMVWHTREWERWERGEWTGIQRWEGWAEAVDWIRENAEQEDRIYLAPMLIETSREPFPTWQHPDYLSFAVRGIYRLDEHIQEPKPIEVMANYLGDWKEKWPSVTRRTRWILIRATRPTVQRIVPSLKSKSQNQVELKDFGGVQVVCVRPIGDVPSPKGLSR